MDGGIRLEHPAPPTEVWDKRYHRTDQDDRPCGAVIVRPREGERPQARALAAAGGMPTAAFDLLNVTGAKKRYVTASYLAMWEYILALDEEERTGYELLLPGLPTKLYVDIDAEFAHNPQLTPEQLTWLMDTLLEEIWALGADIGVSGKPRHMIMDSTRPDKLSKHLVCDFFLRSNYDCGAFMRRVRTRLLRKYEKAAGVGDRDQDHPFFIWSPEKVRGTGQFKNVRAFFVDLKVYTYHRLFRFYRNHKAKPGAQPLLLEGEDGLPQRDTFFFCAVQNYASQAVYTCLEEDGSEPVSTNNADLLRYDVDAVKARHVGKPASKSLDPARVRAHWETYPFLALWKLVGNSADATWKREFAFVNGEGTWRRHLTFRSATGLRNAVQREQPHTLHVGPLEDGEGGTQQNLLVFDVDIRDYATWRPCCLGGARACERCWPIAAFAMRAVCGFVRDWGFGTPHAFFSGNKGIHVWVTNVPDIGMQEQRRALLADFSSVPRAAHATRPYVLEALGDRREWKVFLQSMGQTAELERRETSMGVDRALLSFLWPELDEGVTRNVTHALKAPLGLHGDTGRVCIWLPTPEINPFKITDTHANAKAFGKRIAGTDD